jgi:hypothetical protein
MDDTAVQPGSADLAAARHVNDLHQMHVDHVNHLTALVHKAEANMTPKPVVDGMKESLKEARSILSASYHKLSKLNPLAPKEQAPAE